MHKIAPKTIVLHKWVQKYEYVTKKRPFKIFGRTLFHRKVKTKVEIYDKGKILILPILVLADSITFGVTSDDVPYTGIMIAGQSKGHEVVETPKEISELINGVFYTGH